MKLKTWLTATVGFVIPSGLLKAKPYPPKHIEDSTLVAPINKETTDTLNQDSIILDTLHPDTLNIVPDSMKIDSTAIAWSNLTPREKLRSCADMMLLYISQFEDIKANAYFDRVAKKWTIGPGLTRLHGKPVADGMRIKSVQEMFDAWDEYCEQQNGMFDMAEKYLPLELERPQTKEELDLCKARLCALMDIAYNVGNGFFGSNEKPSSCVEAYTSFLETGDSIYLNKCGVIYRSYNKVKQQKTGQKKENPTLTKRRNISWEVFIGNIKLSEAKPDMEELAENINIWYLKESALGDAYSMMTRAHNLKEDWAQSLNNPSIGLNFADTLQQQFNKSKQPISRANYTVPNKQR